MLLEVILGTRIYFQLTKGRVMLFLTETIVASFLHLMNEKTDLISRSKVSKVRISIRK